ncbi:MAG TPA: hypothetical protein VKP69_13015 [Isosphaeraceae bacterium]|nr:hypothetical protein [Isosphaeraceae bacterium]
MLERRWAWSVIVVAIAARAAAVLALQSYAIQHSTYEHGEIAANLLAGRGFSIRFLGAVGPTSQQAPLYPLLVAGAFALGGVGTPRALLLLELGQAVLGGLLVAGVLQLARELAPPSHPPRAWSWFAGTAGLIAALHPTLVYAATHVQVALLAATLLTATLAWAYRTGRTGRDRDAVIAGAGLAALTLTDPILGLAAVGVAGAVVVGRGGRRAGRPWALVALASALGVAPWIARNARVHGELVPIKSTFGYAFWQGNCAGSEGTDKVVRPSVGRVLGERTAGLRGLNESLWAARHEAGYLDDVMLAEADRRALARVSEPERSRRLFRRALADLRARPDRYPRLCLRRLRYFVLFDETNPKTRNLVYRASHLALTILAVLGWWLAPGDLRRRLMPTAATAALIVLFHTLTIVSARFHIPLEPLMAVWAAAGVLRWGSAAAPAHDLERIGVDGRHPARVRLASTQ